MFHDDRLTAKVVRHYADLDEAVETAATFLRSLTDELPVAQSALRRVEVEQLVAHILVVRSYARRFNIVLSWCGDWAGRALCEAGDFARAITIHNAVLDESLAALGPDHHDTLVSRSVLAFSCRAAGHLSEAIALDEQNLADRERILGPEHSDTLRSRNNLAEAIRMRDSKRTR